MAMHTPEPFLLPTGPAGDAEPRPRRHVYRRAPEPVYFPASEEVPETNANYERRTALYQSLKREVSATATVGSDQFVYWDPTTARKRLAPDVFVFRGRPHRPFRVWKTWKRGAPQLGVEIISDSDESEPDWDEKLARYRAAGIDEVVRFDAEDDEHPVRIWDLVEGDLVERAADDPDLTFCEALGLWWVVVHDEALGPVLRLARDREGRDLLATPDEDSARAREDSARAREGEARAREETERLQAELAALRAQIAAPRAGPPKRRR
jgi:Uma2 family endonuclease